MSQRQITKRFTIAALVSIAAAAAAYFAVLRQPRAPATPAGEPHHIVLLVLDTLRADHMSAYGHASATTPHLDARAGELLRFAKARTPGAWTVPGHASMFTGLLPAQHKAQWGRFRLEPSHLTLAEQLEKHGFCTVGLTANGFVSETTGLSQGFSAFRVYKDKAEVRTQKILDDAEEAIEDATDDGCRMFLFLNFMDTHIPYNYHPHAKAFGVGSPPIKDSNDKWAATAGQLQFAAAEKAQHRAAYDAAVRTADDHVEAVLKLLEAAGILDRTLLVLTSDHGEGLGAHRELGHVLSVWEEQLWVPLLVRFPDGRRGGEVFDRPVSLHGLAASVLDWAEVPRSGALSQAPTLAQTAKGPIIADYRNYFSEAGRKVNVSTREKYPKVAAATAHRHVLYCEPHKLIVSDYGHVQIYDLSTDPSEQSNLSADESVAGECRQAYQQLLASGAFTPFGEKDVPLEPSADELETLRSLGYVQ